MDAQEFEKFKAWLKAQAEIAAWLAVEAALPSARDTDTEWARGHRVGTARTFKRVLERFEQC